jgi:hypothetical protein
MKKKGAPRAKSALENDPLLVVSDIEAVKVPIIVNKLSVSSMSGLPDAS